MEYERGLIKLVRLNPRDVYQKYEYATLSHRWGLPDPAKLSHEENDLEKRISIRKFELGIPISSLPQTFRDAILIVVKSGLEYLWIDSLCILQDKTVDNQNPDWDREAVKMGDIYAGAVFNIAATDSLNSEAGLFPKEQDILLPIVRDFGTVQTPRNSGSANVESGLKFLQWKGAFNFQKDIMDSGLLSRGWVYQEVLLARANLFCSRNQMWWSCTNSSCSQIFPKGELLSEDRDDSELVKDPLRWRKEPILSPSAGGNPITAWTQMLEHYTRTSVTFEDDRLAAIGGLAKVFRSTFPRSLSGALYSSGMWFHGKFDTFMEDCFLVKRPGLEVIAQLYWHNALDAPNIPASRSTSLRFPLPSWSPVSFDGPTRYVIPRAGSRVLAECIGLLGHPDKFGRVKHTDKSCVYIVGVHVPFPVDPETLQYRPDWDWASHPMNFKVIWDNLNDAQWIPERFRIAERNSYPIRALIFEFVPQNMWMAGILLRPCDEPTFWGNKNVGWVRCGFFSAVLEQDTWVECFKHFELNRCGLVCVEETMEDGKHLGWRLEYSGQRKRFDDIYIY